MIILVTKESLKANKSTPQLDHEKLLSNYARNHIFASQPSFTKTSQSDDVSRLHEHLY